MDDAISAVADLSPIAAVVIIGGVLASILTQLAKRPEWTPGRAQLAAVAISVLLGVVAYIVSGVAVGVPDAAVEQVGSAVVVIAGVALMSRAAYAVIGRVGQDEGDEPEPPVTADGVSVADVRESTQHRQRRTDALHEPLRDVHSSDD